MGVATTTQIYEWPDGTSLTLDFNEDGVSSFFFDFCKGGKLMIRMPTSPNPNRRIYLVFVNDILTKKDISKLFGFALDIGATIFPPESSKFDRLQMPRWVSDEEWEKRYDLPNVEVAPFQPNVRLSDWMGIHNLQMRQHERNLNAFWTSAWMAKTKSIKAVWPFNAMTWEIHAVDAEDAKRKVVDHILETERVLPMSQREEWESANVQRGRFLVPTPEEVEIYRLLDLPLPFFFFDSQLREWIEGRTG